MAAIEYHVHLDLTPGPVGSGPVEVHLHLPSPDSGMFQTILERLDTIMSTQAEEVARIQALLPVVDKIFAEVSGAVTELQQLKDIVANIPNADPALTDAVNALASRIGNIDALIPDAPAA